MFRYARLLLCAIALFAAPLSANAATFATSFVSAAVPRNAVGHDAGVDLSGGRYVRLAASGAVSLRGYGSCPRSVGPAGCEAAVSFARLVPSAPTGALIVAFVDRAGAQVTAWAAVGEAAYVVIPARAAHLVFRINGATVRDSGRFRVAVDVVGAKVATEAIATNADPVHRLSVGRQVGVLSPLGRLQAQHLLRRFGFSASAADINAVYASGPAAWLAAQLSPASIDDSALANTLQAMPTYTGNSTTDQNVEPTVEQRIVQREVASKRQLLEKITLHWLEHFAINESAIYDTGAMAHYEDTVRADSLGNFAQLVSDVAKEPAMLYWLNNNFNNGADPADNPPNENFGRELMQLYTIGPNQLNMDGSTVVDSNNVPVPNYTEPDVKAIALALTGFEVHAPYPLPTGVDPRTIDTVTFSSSAHAQGPFTIMNTQIIDPGDATIVDKVVGFLASRPATAPFEAKELLQRFVTDEPSPGYISRIATVWSADVNDPNQIAKVLSAIANDPEFPTAVHGLVKEPVEFNIDAIRALGGANETPLSYSAAPFSGIVYDNGQEGQNVYYPPTVFSFYRPGDKESLLSNSLLLARWYVAVDLVNHTAVQSCSASTTSACSYYINVANVKLMAPAEAAEYLCDALVDGGTPELRALVQNYLASKQSGGVAGAIWIILTSPEFEEN